MAVPSESKLYLIRRARTFITILVAVISFLFIFTAYWTYTYSSLTSRIYPNAPSTHDEIYGNGVDNVLHPQHHTHRSPSTFHYEWVITKGRRRPDGVLKDVYIINNLFPGPVVEVRSGDTLVIHVVNRLPDSEGIAIHWHGLYMRGQNRFDGAVGFTQNPIIPGENFTYEITIANDQWGTFWYHAHEGVQRADGLFGPLIVHRPSDAKRHVDEQQGVEERLLLVGDWYHRPAQDVMGWFIQAASFGNEPVPDSLLVNGRGAYNCSMAVPATPVDCARRQDLLGLPAPSLDAGKSYRFRMINHGSLAGFQIVTNAAMVQVLEVDGGNEVSSGIEGMSLDTLYPGQRVDILVTPLEATSDGRAPYFSISFNLENFKYPNLALKDVQSIPIDIQSTNVSTSFRPTALQAARRISLQLLVAAHPPELPEEADMTIVVYAATQKLAHLHNKPYGFINNTSWKPQSPPLIDAPRKTWDRNQLIADIASGSNAGGPWIDLVINNLDDDGHPFHLHGHDVYVLSSYSAQRGWGSYNPFDAPNEPLGGDYNTANPMKQDTFFIPRHGYTAVRFRAENAGMWMLHCHLLWHQASGMAMGVNVM